MPKLVAATPVTADPITSYPNYWLTDLHILAPDPSGKVAIVGKLRPSAVKADGTVVLHPDPTKSVPVRIPDLFATIAANPTGKLAVWFGTGLEALAEQVPQISSVQP